MEEENLFGKMERKGKKHKKHKGSAHEESNNYSDALHAAVDDGAKLKTEGNKKKKKKKKKEDVVCDVEFNTIQDKAVNMRDCAEVIENNKSEKDQKRWKLELRRDGKEYEKVLKKHRRIGEQGTEVKRSSDDRFSDGGEKERNLQMNKEKDHGENCELKARKDKNRCHWENSDKDGINTISSLMENPKRDKKGKDGVVMGQKIIEKEVIADMKNGDEGNRKKKKGKRDKESSDFEGTSSTADAKEIGKVRQQTDGKIREKVQHVKREKTRDKKKGKDKLGLGLGHVAGKPGDKSTVNEDREFDVHSTRNKRSREVEACSVGTEDGIKRKRKKTKSVKNLSEGTEFKEVPMEKEAVPNRMAKRVRFSSEVEVFPSPDGEMELIRGKRFSPEEDKMVKEAVLNYIKVHGLGEEGLKMILCCKSHPELKGCWQEIGAALPWRPYVSVYYRAHILFERDDKREWTDEEYEVIRRFHEQHGSDWKLLANALGKHRVHVKDTWRRIKLPNRKKGHWSQEEYQKLFDLVNMDLRMKVYEERKSKHGMLRDNICWGAISDQLATRINSLCCVKWYGQLSSPMVLEGEWADADDYRLLHALFSLDACCMEDVDWDNLLDHRSGEVCRKRWRQMVKHIGEHGTKSFSEQVEVLSKRYCPDLLEAREAYDNKPLVT